MFESVLAHEFFHVLEDAYNDYESCPTFWFGEASAKWAEWYFVPLAADEPEAGPYGYFEQFEKDPSVSLTSSAMPYAKWIWPLYMQQHAGVDSIARAWKGMGLFGAKSCTALDALVNAQLPFADNFGNFAVENFDYRLENLATGVQSWPDDFGPNSSPAGPDADYPDFATSDHTSSGQQPPPFPEDMPKITWTAPFWPLSYPWTTKVPVNLPQLSAQYNLVDLPFGTAFEFNFSGLSNADDLDVNLLAADGGKDLPFSHDGTWKRIQVTGTEAKVCVPADQTAGGYAFWQSGGRLSTSPAEFYVIIDNHSSTPASIHGTYTVTALTTCAKALSGSLTLDASWGWQDGPSSYNVQQSATITATLNTCSYLEAGCINDWYLLVPASSWSETYKATSTCPDGGASETASGSGRLNDNDNFDVAAYVGGAGYSFAPWLPKGLLDSETYSTFTSSGIQCGEALPSPSMAIGTGCPWTQFTEDFQGAYTEGDAGVNFGCSDSGPWDGDDWTNNLSGTLTATDPIPCGLWVPENCAIGSSNLEASSARTGAEGPSGSGQRS